MKKFLTRNIVVLSIVSFLTDVASEMLYPIMPLYLRKIGYGALAVGVIEACAEAVSGFNKIFFGHLSDTFKKRKIFIQIGYGVSAIAKPLIGLIPVGAFIFGARIVDRAGKGIRTAPRDAMITAETTPEHRSRAFGFHRAIDTAGAVLGPIVAFLILLKYPGQYALVCILALIPGVLAFIATLFIIEKKAATIASRTHTGELAVIEGEVEKLVDETETRIKKERQTLAGFKKFFRESAAPYRKLVVGFFLLSLLNSSNMFLVLRAKEIGISDMYILFGYITYNIIFAFACYPVGVIADRFGHKKLYVTAITIFALTYVLLGSAFSGALVFILLFSLYGLFSAIEETTSKSWLSLHMPEGSSGRGFGLHLGLNTLGFLVGSLVMGALWKYIGSANSFTIVALLALPVIFYFVRLSATVIPTPSTTTR